MTTPYLTLNNGLSMPQLGFGVWRIPDGAEVELAVTTALDDGYRLIDTAAVYGNETGVGNAIRASGVPRQDIFITTKLWNDHQGYESTLKAFDASLARLSVDYVDLYLIHWPMPKKNMYLDTWKALEEIYASGRAKSIGVSNFTPEHLDNLINNSDVVPAVNQIELHPRFTQKKAREFCMERGIAVESWSPLGGSKGSQLEDATLIEIAKKHGKTTAQIVIRWHLDQGLIVIPKSTNSERIKENFDVLTFHLDEEDMAKIDTLDSNTRYGADPDSADF